MFLFYVLNSYCSFMTSFKFLVLLAVLKVWVSQLKIF